MPGKRLRTVNHAVHAAGAGEVVYVGDPSDARGQGPAAQMGRLAHGYAAPLAARLAAWYSPFMNSQVEIVATTPMTISIVMKLVQPPAPAARRPPRNPNEALAAKPHMSIKQTKVAE